MIARGTGQLPVMLLAAGVVFAPAGAALAQSSPSYRLLASTIAGAGDDSRSLGYALDGSAGQASPVAASASPSFLLQSGFWSFLGAGQVEIVLHVARNAVDPLASDLTWSGNELSYDVYASEQCSEVFDSFYASTSDNSTLDVPQEGELLTCFNVVSSRAPTERVMAEPGSRR